MELYLDGLLVNRVDVRNVVSQRGHECRVTNLTRGIDEYLVAPLHVLCGDGAVLRGPRGQEIPLGEEHIRTQANRPETAILNHLRRQTILHLALGIQFNHGGKDQPHQTERLDVVKGEGVVAVDIACLEDPERILGAAW